MPMASSSSPSKLIQSHLNQVESLSLSLQQEIPNKTAFTDFSRGDIGYEEYIKELRGQLTEQGGTMVNFVI